MSKKPLRPIYVEVVDWFVWFGGEIGYDELRLELGVFRTDIPHSDVYEIFDGGLRRYRTGIG